TRRRALQPTLRLDPVVVVVEHHRVGADVTIRPDAHELVCDERASEVHERPLPDLESPSPLAHQLEGGDRGDELHTLPDHHRATVAHRRAAAETDARSHMIRLAERPPRIDDSASVVPHVPRIQCHPAALLDIAQPRRTLVGRQPISSPGWLRSGSPAPASPERSSLASSPKPDIGSRCSTPAATLPATASPNATPIPACCSTHTGRT